ncbi:hypothetical protein DFH09DRAFT_1220447 [Mycena vulgaris]|nr:hypothetical protein DFH09DRAFT_1220447 [Mycena vulgaris]
MSVPVPADDRRSIGSLYAPPASNRDASQSSSTAWRKPPTKIEKPSNQNTPRAVGGAANPFTGRTKDTLKQPRGGNLVASRTVTGFSGSGHSGEPPAKKPKHGDHTGSNVPPRSRKKVHHFSNGPPPRKPGQSDDTGLIYVDGEYEDIGEPIVGSDDLNIGPGQAGPSGASGSSRHARLIPDGDSTKHLRETRQQRPLLAPENDFLEDSDDPIESSEVEPSSNRVTKLVHEYEGKTKKNQVEPTHPYLDLQRVALRPRGKLKDAMKAKNPPLSAPPAALRLRPNTTNRPPDKTVFLPIKAWYLGHKHFDESYHVVWTKNKMTIRSGEAPGPPAHHVEELDIDMVVETVWYVEPNEPYPNKVIVLETFEKFKKEGKTIGAQFSSFFKQGAPRGLGDIMIRFDGKSPGWDDTTYNDFVDWLKSKVENRETLRGKAGDSKWEAADRVAQLAEVRVRREGGATPNTIPKAIPSTTKPSAVPGLPPINDWSPPARVPFYRILEKPPRLSGQGSPDTPIELESPPRPVPRPTYKGPQSASASGGPDAVRRSARQSVAPQKPYLDPDEVILVYPPGQTGAVNITNGDLTRLAPGEFLNDTLIEFGLKLWLQQLEKDDPELVKQIHVFSSFFYKKLNKKNALEGYESVRKWTSKFDLFDKKYIIIPINENLHWYLAIIYHPEYILLPPPPTKSPSTRRKAREEAEHSPELDQPRLSRLEQSSRPPDSKSSSVTRRTPTPVENGGGRGSGTLSPSSNAQAEEVFNMVSCSITDDDAPISEVQDHPEGCATDDEPNSLFDGDGATDMDVDLPEASEAAQEQPPPPVSADPPPVSAGPSDDGGSHTASEGPAIPDLDIMDVDAQDETRNESLDPLDLFTPSPAPAISEEVKPTNFYGSSAKSRGKRKAESPPFSMQEFPPDTYDEDTEDITSSGQPQTYVFTLDSLGSRHPKVVSVLGQYLQFEARERKNIPLDLSSKPVGKMALVPHQPNFCDCGIYLLHLAQTFISAPSHYYNLITMKKGNKNSLERQSDWNDERTKMLREGLAQQIEELSIEWKKNRAAKAELKKEELKNKQDDKVVPESSDDDVDIVDTTPAPPQKEKPPKTPKKTVGKAMRMRGG